MKKKYLRYIRMQMIALFMTLLLGLNACAISYKFNGASIDYSKIKTIHIADIMNQAPLVYAPLASLVTEELKDIFTKRTKLQFVKQDADLDISGEITGYDLTPEAIQQDALAARTKFTLTIMIHYRNRVNPTENFDRSFSAFTEFDSSQMFSDVQGPLCEELYKDIINQILNATIENW